MIRILALIAALICLPASAAPFHYLAAFVSEAAAKSDPIVGQYWNATSGSWDQSQVIPNVLAYIPANDTPAGCGGVVASTQTPYDSNWLILISLPARNEALEAESTTHIVYDTAICDASGLIYSWIPAASLSAVMLQPIWQGACYPFGQP